MCSSSARWGQRLDWRRKIVWLPSQTPGLLAAVGLSDDEADAEAWAVMLNGECRAGAAAMMAGLDQYVPAGLRVFTVLSSLPGLRQLTERGYGWVARNRHTLLPGLACTVGYRPPSLEPAVVDELQRRMGPAVNPPRR